MADVVSEWEQVEDRAQFSDFIEDVKPLLLQDCFPHFSLHLGGNAFVDRDILLSATEQLQPKRVPMVFKEQALRFVRQIFTVVGDYYALYDIIGNYHSTILRLNLRGPELYRDGAFTLDVKNTFRNLANQMRCQLEQTAIHYATTAYMLWIVYCKCAEHQTLELSTSLNIQVLWLAWSIKLVRTGCRCASSHCCGSERMRNCLC
jgi:hypothetical protein